MVETLGRYAHCLSRKCYTTSELALYGTGFLVLGLLVAVVLVAVYQGRCSTSYSYDVEDGGGGDRCKKESDRKSDFHSQISLSGDSEANTIESLG